MEKVNDLAESLESNASPQTDKSIEEAEQILDELKNISFEKWIDRAQNELENVLEFLNLFFKNFLKSF